MQSMCNSFVIEEKERWILLNPEPQTQRHRTSLFFYIDCSNQHRKREKTLHALRFEEKMVSKMISEELWSCSNTLSAFYPLFLLHFFPLSLSLSLFHFYFTASRRMQCYNLNHPPKTDRSINSWIKQGVFFFFLKYASKLLNEYIFWLIWYFSIKKTINYSLSSGCWASVSLDEWNLVFKGTIC